jgi:hypothetical protein
MNTEMRAMTDAELDEASGGQMTGCMRYYSDGPTGAGMYVGCGPNLGELINNFFAAARLPPPFHH